MKLGAIALLAVALAGSRLQAQSEARLKEYFEGRTVTLKLAMPGTEAGVDVYPGTSRPLDYPRYADRLKDNGTAIETGQTAMVTRIRVKSKHIEFHLDGGGYGTMGDETSSSIAVTSAEKSRREKNLEAELKRESDPDRKRELKEELDDLRKEREREDARNRAQVAAAEEQKEANIRQRRLKGGSRFNVRFRDALPAEVLTPEGLKSALADYVVFGDMDAGPAAGLPRKGMSAQEVDGMLGAPASSGERMEGTLRVVTRSYRASAGLVTAEFVEGVLIRYSVTSE